MLLHRWSAAISILLSSFGSVSAQSTSQDSPEPLIRRLDRTEAEGLLHRDSTALRKIWARDFTVNNPRNSITRGSEEVIALIRNGTIDYSSFVREIETILFHGKHSDRDGRRNHQAGEQSSLCWTNSAPPLYTLLDEAEWRMAFNGTTCERGMS